MKYLLMNWTSFIAYCETIPHWNTTFQIFLISSEFWSVSISPCRNNENISSILVRKCISYLRKLESFELLRIFEIFDMREKATLEIRTGNLWKYVICWTKFSVINVISDHFYHHRCDPAKLPKNLRQLTKVNNHDEMMKILARLALNDEKVEFLIKVALF